MAGDGAVRAFIPTLLRRGPRTKQTQRGTWSEHRGILVSLPKDIRARRAAARVASQRLLASTPMGSGRGASGRFPVATKSSPGAWGSTPRESPGGVGQDAEELRSASPKIFGSGRRPLAGHPRDCRIRQLCHLCGDWIAYGSGWACEPPGHPRRRPEASGSFSEALGNLPVELG